MLLLSLFRNPAEFVFFIVAIFLALSVHESAHAWTANLFGDPTAKQAGRISLNPFAHLDPMGTLFLLLLGFGWGKPVPVNPNNFKEPKIDELTVALAGPVSNLIFAAIFGLIIRFIPMPEILTTFLYIVILINLVLMTFNLLPIAPLDGSRMVSVFLSEKASLIFQQCGMPLLLTLILLTYVGVPILSQILNTVVGGVFRILTGTNLTPF